ncbi:YobA family protein [Neobacillus mesonae]|nr:YobA family protein [Neobacillus mesonae]
MRYSYLSLLIMLLLLSACGYAEEESQEYNSYEGIVAFKEIRSESYQLLVVPDVDPNEVTDKTREEIINMNVEGTSYYDTNQEDYESVEVGDRVKIQAGIDELESSPPIRSVIKLEVVE